MLLFGGQPDIPQLVVKKGVGGLIKALGYQKDAGVRKAAAEALGRAGDPSAVGPLIAALNDLFVHLAAIDALATLYEYSAEPLIAALTNEAPEVRAGAAAALGPIGGTRATASLLTVLFDTEGDVRCEAVEELGKICDVQAASSLAHALGDRDPKVRRAAAARLWKFGPGPWVEPLASALEDPDQKVRDLAFGSLARIGDPRAVERLIAILRGHDGWQERTRAVAPLITELVSNEQWVRQAAARALVAIYQAGSLDEASKARVLGQRDVMTRFHSDHDTGCVGDNSHEHIDEGIGVDFPV